MKKYEVFILMLFAVFACKKDGLREEEKEETEENPEKYELSLSGFIWNMNVHDLNGSAFKLQLIKGEIRMSDFGESYTHPEAQVFITEKENNEFEFNGLQEGTYTLLAAKRGYKSLVRQIELKRNMPGPISVNMEKEEGGFTGKMQILDENGHDLSEVEINRNSTMSVYFYLYNGKGTTESYNMQCLYEGYLGKSFMIDGEIVHLYSTWVKEIKPCSGALKPNEIKLIEVVIDPLVYLLREHSECRIRVSFDLELNLSY